MDWRLKAGMMWSFHVLPGGSMLHYTTQRHVTRSLPRMLEDYPATAEAYLRHFRAIDSQFPTSSREHLLEFGAGRDLFGNLLAWCYGVERQTVVDIDPLVRPELVNHAIAALQRDPLPDFRRVPGRAVSLTRCLDDLRDLYSIDYRAPADARSLDLDDGSVDLVVTTNTLEHIPESVLVEIFAEVDRVVAPDGLISHVVDYSDHYSHNDPTLTPYSMLGYGERAWKWFCPPDLFQNRLRHSDFGRLLTGPASEP